MKYVSRVSGQMYSRLRTVVSLKASVSGALVEESCPTSAENWVPVVQLVASHCSAWAVLTQSHTQCHYGHHSMEHILIMPVPDPPHKIAVSILVRLFSKEQISVFSFWHIEARLTFVYTNSCFASLLPSIYFRPHFVILVENGITVHYHDNCGLISFLTLYKLRKNKIQRKADLPCFHSHKQTKE
jgi:hypothetical protein